jgi:hypothetical protein
MISMERTTFQLMLMAAILAFITPFVKLVIIYLNILAAYSLHYAQYGWYWVHHRLNIAAKPTMIPALLAQIFWPLLLGILIDKSYSRIKKRRFDYPYLCALFIWFIINGSQALLQ